MSTVSFRRYGGRVLCGEFLKLWIEWTVPATMLIFTSGSVLSGFDVARALPLVAVIIASLVIWIVWQDLRSYTISDAAASSLAILAIAARLSVSDPGEPAICTVSTLVVDGGLPGASLLLFRETYFRCRGVDGLGLGDVKIAVAGGLLIGVVEFSWAMVAASIIGLVIMTGLRFVSCRPQGKMDRLAFGAVLTPILFIIWVLQHEALWFAGP
jgi:leader peptidase (prepilin peptidase)/N-methyltransferase